MGLSANGAAPDANVPAFASAGWAWRRILTAMRPDVHVTAAPPMTIEWNVPVTVRDGTRLRVNVFRPLGDAVVPAIMSAHPYGKDRIPLRTRSKRGVSAQYRLFPQPRPIQFSELTNWEAPDPAFWVAHGYAVVNADLRGGGTSEGIADLLSDQEAEDYHDLIEWTGTQPWCTGKVGLNGVSYLAISQYKAAALHPPHLAAICPWEGLSDLYRDWCRPGGVREDGFSRIWSAQTRRLARTRGDLRKEIVAREELDDWYRARTPVLERIEAPLLQCASFSDHSLHSRGSFEAFRRARSARKWLYTHRDGKWSHYYGQTARTEMLRFFDHVLKDMDNGWQHRAKVRLAVHEHGPDPAEIMDADDWPPPGLDWTTLHLDTADQRLRTQAPAHPGSITLKARRDQARFAWTIPEDLDIIGPMALTVQVSLPEGGDANLFVGVRKFHRGRQVRFEGSFGFSRDVVTRGWQRLAHRRLDESLSLPCQPVHSHDRAEPLKAGEITPVQIALLPHATRFRAGDEFMIEIRNRWLFPRDPLRGQFPAAYQRGPATDYTLHTGQDKDSTLLLGIRRR